MKNFTENKNVKMNKILKIIQNMKFHKNNNLERILKNKMQPK